MKYIELAELLNIELDKPFYVPPWEYKFKLTMTGLVVYRDEYWYYERPLCCIVLEDLIEGYKVIYIEC
jgi:hypothetical protein